MIENENKNNDSNSISISQQFTKESMYSISWLIIFRISGIICSIIIANLLIESHYGMYSVLSSWGLILNYVSTFGIPLAAAKIIAENRVKNPDKNATLFGNMILINVINLIIISIFTFLTLNFLIFNVYNINFHEIQLFESLLLLTLLKTSIFTIYSLEQGIATGYREFKIIAIIFIVGYSLKIPILYYFILNQQLVGVLITEIITDLIILCSFFMFLLNYFKKKNLKFSFKFDKEQIKKLYSLGIPTFLANFIFIIVSWFGMTILSVNYSFIDVGVFQISLNIVNLIFLIPYGIISPFLPEITEKYENNLDDFYKTVSKVLKLIILIIFPLIIFVGLFSPLLIEILYPKYYNSITFYSVYTLLPYIFINGFTLVYFYSFISMEKSRILIMLEICKGVSFFIFILILVPTYGIVGLSYVFFLSFLVYAIIYQLANIHYKFKFHSLPFILLSIIYGSFLFYSSIFHMINLYSPIWILGAFSIIFISTLTSFLQLWKDKDCKDFIINIFNIFRRSSNSD